MNETHIARTPSACENPLLLQVKLGEAIDKTGVVEAGKVELREKRL